jgi:hypothetical protein
MNDLKKAAQQALEAMDKATRYMSDSDYRNLNEAITALRAALAEEALQRLTDANQELEAALEQPEQEPVAYWHKPNQEDEEFIHVQAVNGKCPDCVPLYTNRPRREWRGLKEWEINDGLDQLPTEDVCSWSFRKGVYFAEKALKERNA